MSAISSFDERRRELEALLDEVEHETWKRDRVREGNSGDSAAGQEWLLDQLMKKLGGEAGLAGRERLRVLAEAVFEAGAERLRTISTLAARLSAEERVHLAQLMRRPGEERRALAAFLRLHGEDRAELATAFGLSTIECRVLADLVDEPGGDRGAGRPPEGVKE